MDLEKLLLEIKKLSKEVGDYQLSMWRNDSLAKGFKSSEIDIVTEVDKKSEEIIVSRLKGLTPNCSILGEEGTNVTGNEYKWIIDPLDGTVNYASGLPIFAISFGLLKGDENIFGLVYIPYLNETFWAIKGKGAYINDKRIFVNTETELKKSLIATGFPYDRASCGNEKNNNNYFRHIMPKVRGIRRMGAACYDLCLVASGYLNGFWEMGLKPWDLAGPKCIIEEAGGFIHFFREDRDISITCGNKDIADKLLEEIDYVNSLGIKLLEEN